MRIRGFPIYFIAVLLLALIQVCGAILGMSMALEPHGHLTPLWPPAGTAFAVLLLAGYRFWPGIALGSFLFNAFHFYQEAHIIAVPSLLACIGIAAGTTLQAILGVFLARRWLGYLPGRWQLGLFIKTLLVGGFLVGWVGSSIGVASLLAIGHLPVPHWPTAWLSWWVSCGTGVLIVGGFIISSWHQIQRKDPFLVEDEGRKYLGHAFSIAVLGMAVMVSLWQWQLAKSNENARNFSHFERLASIAQMTMTNRLNGYEDTLHAAAGLIQASSRVTPQEWRDYVGNLGENHNTTGILGFGFVMSAQPAQTSARQSEISSYAGLSQYGEGIRTFADAPFFMEAAELARDQGAAGLTIPVQLSLADRMETCFWLIEPIYRKGMPTTTVAQRRAALRGWVYAPFIGDHVFEDLFQGTQSEIGLIVDDQNTGQVGDIFRSDPKEASLGNPLFQKKNYFLFGGRHWEITWYTSRYFQPDGSGQSTSTLFFGLITSLMLATLLLNLNTTRDRAVRLAEKATRETGERNRLLKEANETLARELQERNRIERMTQEIGERNRHILNAMEEGIVGFDKMGGVQFANPAAARFLGCESIGAIMGVEDFHETFHHAHADGMDYDKSTCPIQKAAICGVPARVDNEIFWRLDEVSFPVEYTVTPVFRDGELSGAVMVFRDISEKVARKRLLKETARRFEAIFNQSFQFIGLMSPDGILLEANESALKASNIAARDVIGKPLWESPWWSHSAELQMRLQDAVKRATNNEFVRFEAQHPGLDGEMLTVDFSLKPMQDEKGTVTLLIPEGRDITHLKKVEEERRQMLEELQEVARMRRNFVSTLTHDLRTPLIAQHRVLENLQSEPIISRDEKLSFLLRGFLKNNRDLLLMVNNLLETYQLEDGRLQLLPEYVSLFELAELCAYEQQGAIEDRDIRLVNKISPLLEPIEADALLLKRMFQNLIGNAVANIPAGSMIVLDAADWDEYVDITVSDNGTGIPQELVPHIFTKYLAGFGTRKKIGSGLGLYICKMISELHGGTIRVDNPPEGGAAIQFTLPKKRSTS